MAERDADLPSDKLVADVTRGWHRTTHWLHQKAVRDAVVEVLVVVGRLQTKVALPAEAPSNAGAAAGTTVATAHVALLPIEVWVFAMRFFKGRGSRGRVNI